jgi:hypothetical protein
MHAAGAGDAPVRSAGRSRVTPLPHDAIVDERRSRRRERKPRRGALATPDLGHYLVRNVCIFSDHALARISHNTFLWITDLLSKAFRRRLVGVSASAVAAGLAQGESCVGRRTA